MAITLLQQLIVFLIMIAMGFILVKKGAAKSEDSKLLSVISIYFLMPCAIVKSFLIHMTPQIFRGMVLAVLVSVAIHLLFMIIVYTGKKLDRWDAVEMATIMYPNAGNLILPIIPVMFGDEWVIYASAFMCVQTAFFWTHCVSLFDKKGKFSLAKVLKNPNVLAMITGMVICVLPFRLPFVVTSVLSTMAAVLAPAAMLTIGMLLADLKMGDVVKKIRTYRIMGFRLLICPLLVMLLLKITAVGSLVDQGNTILLITLLACMAPPAASITQIAQVYDGDAKYASSLNSLCLIGCVVTMPLMTAIYGLLIH